VVIRRWFLSTHHADRPKIKTAAQWFKVSRPGSHTFIQEREVFATRAVFAHSRVMLSLFRSCPFALIIGDKSCANRKFSFAQNHSNTDGRAGHGLQPYPYLTFGGLPDSMLGTHGRDPETRRGRGLTTRLRYQRPQPASGSKVEGAVSKGKGGPVENAL